MVTCKKISLTAALAVALFVCIACPEKVSYGTAEVVILNETEFSWHVWTFGEAGDFVESHPWPSYVVTIPPNAAETITVSLRSNGEVEVQCQEPASGLWKHYPLVLSDGDMETVIIPPQFSFPQ